MLTWSKQPTIARPAYRLRASAVALLLVTVMVRAQDNDPVRFSAREKNRILRLSPLGPPPPSPTNRVADDDRAARLGQFLFFDTGLSGNGAVSCATCHKPDAGFADSVPISRGVGRAARHTPALWNVAYNRWFFWDGRADTLWAQALEPIENPVEMASSRLQVAHHVADNDALREAYLRTFGQLPELNNLDRFPAAGRPVTSAPDHPHQRAWSAMSRDDQQAVNRVFTNVTKAIAAYQRRIVSRNAPFDVFVEGLRTGDSEKRDRLSPAAQRGLKLFVTDARCRLCHSGPNFTDEEFHDTRIPPATTADGNDPGRYGGIVRLLANPFNAAGIYADKRDQDALAKLEYLALRPDFTHQFKTPTLRNVALTAPYMHNGRFKTLADVVHFYSTLEGAMPAGHHRQEQILKPLHLSDRQIRDLVAFLESLTDDRIDPSLTRPPLTLPDTNPSDN